MYEKPCKSYVILSISTALAGFLPSNIAGDPGAAPVPSRFHRHLALHTTWRRFFTVIGSTLAITRGNPNRFGDRFIYSCVFYWESRFQSKVKHVWFIGAHVYMWTLIYVLLIMSSIACLVYILCICLLCVYTYIVYTLFNIKACIAYIAYMIIYIAFFSILQRIHSIFIYTGAIYSIGCSIEQSLYIVYLIVCKYVYMIFEYVCVLFKYVFFHTVDCTGMHLLILIHTHMRVY